MALNIALPHGKVQKNTEKEQENQEETPNQEPPRNNDDWVE